MANIREATLTLKVDSAQARAALREFIKETDGLSTAAGRTESVLGKLTKVLGSVYLGYRALRFIKESIQDFATFERQMTKVSTVLDEQTMRFLPGYAMQIRKMSVDMGESTTSLSQGLYEILQAMIPADQAMKVLDASSKAAAGGMTTTAIAVDAVTTVLNAYGLSGDKAAKVSSDLYEAALVGKMEFADIAQNIGKVAAAAAQAGISLEELLAAMATLTRGGLQSELAATSIRSILMQFLRPTPEAIKASQELGLAMNATTLHTIGLLGVLDKLKNASPEVIASIVRDTHALAGFSIAIQDATGMTRDYNYILQKGGQDVAAYEKMLQTPAKQFERFQQAMESIKRTVGAVLAPVLADAAVKFADWVGANTSRMTTMAQLFENEFDRIKDILVAFVTYLRTDFNGASDVAWNAFLAGMELAARAAIDLAIRTGKGIWGGIRQGIFGGSNEGAIKDRALEIWKGHGGQTEEVAVKKGSMLSVQGLWDVEQQPWGLTSDGFTYPQAVAQARAEASAKYADGFLAGYNESLKVYAEQAQARVQNAAPPALLNQWAKINAEHDARGQALNAQYDYQKGLEDWDKIVAWTNDAVAWVKGVYGKFTQATNNQPTYGRSYREEKVYEPTVADSIARKRVEDMQFETQTLTLTNEKRAEAIALREAELEAQNKQVTLEERHKDAIKRTVAELERVKRLTDMAFQMGDAFGQAFEDVILGAKKAGEAVNALVADITRILIRKQVTEPLANAIGAGLSQLLVNGFGPAVGTSPVGDVNPAMGFYAHSGWAVGTAGAPMRSVPSWVWARAPRLHEGLDSDEFPAILQRGERVLSRNQVKAADRAPGIQLNIINQSSTPVQADIRNPRIDVNRMVAEVILKDQRVNGPITRGFRGMR